MGVPGVSVVLPVFNGARFLADALTSIVAQEVQALEVIVVDDGSTDESFAIAEAWRPPLRTLRQPNAGPTAARNRGIEIAQGELIAFLDADDLWLAGSLRRHCAILDSWPELDFVLGPGRVEHAERSAAARFRSAEESIAIFSFGAGLFRRRAFDRVGLLSEDLRNAEDTDWFMRARDAGLDWLPIEDVGLVYRRRQGTASRPLPASQVFQVLARASARRRTKPKDVP